ncbi:adhesion G protein-coupled receptor B2-like isoform X3 [Anguilla anguilla]|uniref:adhesion G protein-coupled receptor B2-like isoform X3 n=1 Tax=Anguilla anguilla TaxID=7936 RepID=UPI0015AE3BEB|nr:adhesion G protein-coupled receptor B2-like isoform X3 [Anguilla anguilla]
MTPARPVCVSVLSSLLALAWGQDSSSSPSSSFFACSSMVQGVLYGSFSLRDLFPSPITPGCSWTVENPDPTKYTLFVRFRHHGPACQAFAPVLLPLDHYLANQSCAAPVPADPELVDLCQPSGSHAFMQFDKNFVQLCLTTAPAPTATPTATPTDDPVTMEMLAFHLVEVLLINNENSSQFTCGVLCRWFEECLRSGRESEGCGITQTGCICPDADMTPPFLLTPATPNNDSAHRHTPDVLPAPPDDCCVTQTPSLHAIALVPRDVPHDSEEDDLRVKTQRPRSVDLPGLYQAQTGDPAAEEWSQWSMCSLTCGQGLQVRTRSCVASPYGTLCSGPLRESRVCNNTVTCPVHGLWEEWSPWSLCSVTCGRGSRTRTRSCVAPQHGGKTCGGPELQSKLCNIAVCPVEGQWWDWSSWSRCSVSCGGGVQHRQRRCRVSVHGWTECRGAHAETRQCSSQDCGGGGNWGSWNQWGSCSKTCDSGWQRRLRMCQGVGLQGYPCEGSGEEVRACNDRKCPAPHQMCKDEHREAVSWKSAAAGDTVYSKCPSNATGSASRRCLLDSKGVAYWGPPTFARCVSLEFRYLHLSQLREHLSKGQRTLAGEGMSQIVRSLHQLMSRRRYHSGDLLFSVEILRNVTDTFKRATYVPAPDDVQKFFQIISFMLDVENRGKWEDAQQVSPGSVLLMRVVEDFIHLVGEAQKAFQSSLIITDNLMLTVQREPASAVSSDVNFPMKGRRGMKDWARSSEDKLFIPKEVFTLASEESDETSYFVIGAVLYRTLGFILPPPQSPLVVSSKVLTVTVRPPPKDTEGTVAVELSSLLNGTSDHQCVTLEYWNTEDADYWDTEGCQTLPSPSLHTKCLCSRLSTFAVLGQQPRAQVVGPSRLPSVPLMIGCGVSCTALFILLVLYAALWRFIRSERSMILLNFSVAILASNVLILLGQSHSLGRVSQVLCTITAIALHFFFLSSFCWVLAEAWQSYLAVNGNTRTRFIRKRFLCLGWGLPALVVAVSVGFTRARGYGSASSCWLSLEGGLLYAFVGPAAVIVLVNMLIGIVIFNKLVSRDGISDKSKKQKAGPQPHGLVPKYSRCGVNSHSTLPKTIATNATASLWSSCVVLPLLALTWMSAVLAITDRSSTLFQVLFAVFDALQGVVIISVHGALRREVQDALCGRMGVCKDDSENSPDSCKNGQTDFEKDVDLACQTVIFKEPTISGTLSRISLDDEDDPKLAGNKEVGVNLGGLPGLVAPPTLLVQAPPLGVEPQLKEVNVEQQGAPVYLCTESGLGWVGSGGGAGGLGGAERDYMVLPGRTGGLQTPPLRGEEKNMAVHDSALPAVSALRLADGKALYSFASMDHLNVNLTPPCRTLRPLPAHTLHFKPHPSVRHILSGSAHRTRTLPRKLGHTHTSLSVGSLEKVMHTRQRHNELYHELNHPPEFHTPGPKRRDPTASSVRRERRWSISSTEGENNSSSDRTPPDDQHPCDNVRTVTFDPSCAPAEKMDKLELNQIWGTAPATTPETEGDFQTEV